MVRCLSSAVLLLLAATALAAEPGPPAWTALSDVREVQVLSENSDGTPRETTVWLAVADAEGFIRTGNTSWYPNLERKPEIAVRVSGQEYPVRAELVTDDSLRETVMAVFREKYGWSDRFVAWFFPGDPHIVRLAPR
jgi:hypothetical protein